MKPDLPRIERTDPAGSVMIAALIAAQGSKCNCKCVKILKKIGDDLTDAILKVTPKK